MAGFVEPHPDVIAPNPGGADDPLGESVLDPAQPWLRVFEPTDVRLVIGRHQDPHRECLVAHARADGIPIHRRVAGGGAVVLAPGMVVVAIRLQHTQTGVDCYFGLVNDALRPAVLAASGVEAACRGHGDLTIADGDGARRKVLGASLRQTAKLVVYLGVFLVEAAAPLMDRYLAFPSRQPDYRGSRSHGEFCTALARHGTTTASLLRAVERSCREHLTDHALW